MSLRIDTNGAQVFLNCLERISLGEIITETNLEQALKANRFFVDFYNQWPGADRESLGKAIRSFAKPGWEPGGPVLAALCRGFRQAVAEAGRLRDKIEFWKEMDPTALVQPALAHLPEATPIQSTLHLTIDDFNGGFQFRGEIGLSLLRDVTDPGHFEATVAHELHHAGFHYWAGRDPVRQAILAESSGRSIAIQHVQNLLAEGLAIFYCSPLQIEPEPIAGEVGPPPEPYQAKLQKYRREESFWFGLAEKVLVDSLEPGATLQACRQAAEQIAIDLEGIEPAGHYLGARMVEIMSQALPHEQIIECVRSLPAFLPRYNRAAREVGGYEFDPLVVEEFGAIMIKRSDECPG